jgi:hypothetical protein
MSGLLMERLKFIKGIDPVADAFDSTVHSDVVNMKDLARVAFVIFAGVGTTGTSTITIEACDDVTPSNTTAIPFYWQEILTGDTEAAAPAAEATTGVVTTAGSSKICIAEVRQDALAASGRGYVRLTAVESVNSPVLAGILILGEEKIPGATKPTAIV